MKYQLDFVKKNLFSFIILTTAGVALLLGILNIFYTQQLQINLQADIKQINVLLGNNKVDKTLIASVTPTPGTIDNPYFLITERRIIDNFESISWKSQNVVPKGRDYVLYFEVPDSMEQYSNRGEESSMPGYSYTALNYDYIGTHADPSEGEGDHITFDIIDFDNSLDKQKNLRLLSGKGMIGGKETKKYFWESSTFSYGADCPLEVIEITKVRHLGFIICQFREKTPFNQDTDAAVKKDRVIYNKILERIRASIKFI